MRQRNAVGSTTYRHRAIPAQRGIATLPHGNQHAGQRASQRASQRGVALIMVLMVVALVTILAAAMLSRHHLSIARTQQLADISQARAYALGAEEFARELLLKDLRDDHQLPHTDKLSDIWGTPQAPFKVECGALQIQIRDAQDSMNVNALTLGGTNPALTRVRQLLTANSLEPGLADVIKDWVDADQDVSGFGGEDSAYLLRAPAYRAANNSMTDVSELRLIGDLPAEQQQKLLSVLTVLPTANGQINVNTATAAGYLAVAPQLSPGEAQSIAEGDRSFKDPAEFINAYPAFGPAVDALTVSSNYFEVHVRVDCHDATVHLQSLIYRDPTTVHARVLSRNFGRRWFLSAATDGGTGDQPGKRANKAHKR